MWMEAEITLAVALSLALYRLIHLTFSLKFRNAALQIAASRHASIMPLHPPVKLSRGTRGLECVGSTLKERAEEAIMPSTVP
jgi:hypothetical protein